MSRVSKNPVHVPEKVEVNIFPMAVTISGPLGSLSQPISNSINIVLSDSIINIITTDDTKETNELSGTTMFRRVGG